MTRMQTAFAGETLLTVSLEYPRLPDTIPKHFSLCFLWHGSDLVCLYCFAPFTNCHIARTQQLVPIFFFAIITLIHICHTALGRFKELPVPQPGLTKQMLFRVQDTKFITS